MHQHFFGVFVCLLCLAGTPAAAQEGAEQKKADIAHLLEVTQTAQLGPRIASAVAAQSLDSIRARYPEMPQELVDTLVKEVQVIFAESADTFLAMTATLYDKYYSAEEIRELIQFYSTAVGRKSIEVMPALMADSMTMAQEWTASLLPKIQQRLKKTCDASGYPI